MSVPDWMIDTPSPNVEDMAAVIRQLVRSLRKAAPDNEVAKRAMDYLKKHGLEGSPLRATPARPQAGDAVRELDDLVHKFEGFIYHATGGRLSKHTWALETLKSAHDEYLTAHVADMVKDALATAPAAPVVLTDEQIYDLLNELSGIDTHDLALRDHADAYEAVERAILAAQSKA